jgi:hypothetical protein
MPGIDIELLLSFTFGGNPNILMAANRLVTP